MEKKHKTIAGVRLAAMIEILLFLVIALVADTFFFDGTRYFTACPHPFWIIVLLVTVQYGTAEGVLCTIASTAAMLIGNMPEQAVGQDSYQYAMMVSKTPIMWFVASVILGELQQRHIRARTRLSYELEQAQERENTIAQSYQWVKELKEKLELRIAGQLRSGISTYKAARAMETLDPGEVINGLDTLTKAVMNAEKFSIYTMGARGFEVALMHGWNEKDNYPRQFDKTSPLYQGVVSEKRPICAANDQHEAMLAGQGVLAGALINTETGDIAGMLKIEKLGFSDLNLSTIETFHALCEWAGMALVNARHYQTAKSESVIDPEKNLMTSGYFQRYVDHIQAVAKRTGFNVTMVSVRVSNAAVLDDEARLRVCRLLADAIRHAMRTIDLAFDHQANGEDFALVLPGTDRAGAEIVIEKLRKELGTRIRAQGIGADFTYSIQALHEK